MTRWLLCPECLRLDKKDSKRWMWFIYDENWQHVNKGIRDTEEEAMFELVNVLHRPINHE